MLQPSEYLDYIHCDLAGPYPTNKKGNRFYLGVQNTATGPYYAEAIRIKSSFVKKSISLENSLSIYVLVLRENELIKRLRNIHPRSVSS